MRTYWRRISCSSLASELTSGFLSFLRRKNKSNNALVEQAAADRTWSENMIDGENEEMYSKMIVAKWIGRERRE